jgi:hypothetical protein
VYRICPLAGKPGTQQTAVVLSRPKRVIEALQSIFTVTSRYHSNFGYVLSYKKELLLILKETQNKTTRKCNSEFSSNT